MSKPALFGILFVVVVVAVLIYSSMNLASHRVEVCMDFNGRSSCKTASGATREYALQRAVENACAGISSGVTETIACQHTPPAKTAWLK